MNWLERMNDALDYIETHLDNPDIKELAAISTCSIYNFQRIFSYITDMSLSDYIRNRRMTQAAFDLQHTDYRVIDIALRYGYESDISFARAFKRVHGVSPSQACSEKTVLKVYPKLTFQLSIKGVVNLDYRIEEKKSFKFFGVGRTFDVTDGAHYQDIPLFWRELIDNGTLEKLGTCAGTPENKELTAVHALSGYDKDNDGSSEGTYMIGCFLQNDSKSEGFGVVEIPSSKWAIFQTELHEPPETSRQIQNLNKRIYSEWLPNSGYEFLSGYEMELYYANEDGKCYCECWIRVKG